MSAALTALLSRLGSRLVLGGSIAFAIILALWIAARRGRHQAEAEFMVRRADARVRAMIAAKETRHATSNTDRADLDRRADRWMRD